MPEYNFFGMADIWESLFWVAVFVAIVVIGLIWHWRAKKRLNSINRK